LGQPPEDSHKEESEEPPDFTPADFQIDVTGPAGTTRPTPPHPTGYQSIDEYEQEDVPERVAIHFAGSVCDTCTFLPHCPVKLNQHTGTSILKADLIKSTSSVVG